MIIALLSTGNFHKTNMHFTLLGQLTF